MKGFSFPIELYKYCLTRNASNIAKKKGFTNALIDETFRNPKCVSVAYLNKHRITGNDGLCLVGVPDKDTQIFTIITIFNDEKEQKPQSQSQSQPDTPSSSEKFSFPIELYEYTLTKHAEKMATTKGFATDLIEQTFKNPKRVYVSGSHIGQHRVTGNGLCLVGVPDPDTKIFTIITVYEDEVITPPRPDQLDKPEGQRFAERYAKGLGRG